MAKKNVGDRKRPTSGRRRVRLSQPQKWLSALHGLDQQRGSQLAHWDVMKKFASDDEWEYALGKAIRDERKRHIPRDNRTLKDDKKKRKGPVKLAQQTVAERAGLKTVFVNKTETTGYEKLGSIFGSRV